MFKPTRLPNTGPKFFCKRILRRANLFTLSGVYCSTLVCATFLFDSSAHVLTYCLLPCLIWASVVDWETYEIPDSCTLSIAFIGVAHSLFLGSSVIWTNIFTGFLVLVFFWIMGEVYFRLRNVDGLGIGDAKLFGAGAVVLGPQLILDMIFLACIGGLIAIMFLRYRGKLAARGTALGPFISYAIFLLSFQEKPL